MERDYSFAGHAKPNTARSWRGFVAHAYCGGGRHSATNIWRLGKQIKNRWARTASFTPELVGPNDTVATDAEEKMTLLKDTFFPKARQADLDDIQGYRYPDPKEFPPVTI